MKNHTSQCDSCTFKISESQAKPEDDRAVEKKYQVLRSLENAPEKPRKSSVSFGVEKTDDTDKTETCFVDSPLWPSKIKNVRCPDRVDECLPLEAALSLRSSAEANRIATEALKTARKEASSARSSARWAIWSAIIAAITAIIATR